LRGGGGRPILQAVDADARTLEAIYEELQARRGVDLRDFRPTVIQRRIKSRADRLHLPDLESYLALLRQRPSESEDLLRHLCIKASHFLRDRPVLQRLERDLLRPAAGRPGAYRIWSAGCAFGEEPYTLAALAAQAGLGDRCEILATDIDDSALARAAAGVYPRWAVGELDPAFVAAAFDPAEAGGRAALAVKPSLKRMVRFERADLLSGERAPSGPGFDLILCRNVLIYFTRAAQSRVLHRLREALAPRGHLCLGEAETLTRSASDLFETVDQKARLYRAL
jgi:chemotaxis methyl-accepting protein methylase